MSYGIKNGQIYLAADGGHFGYLVIDTNRYAGVDDVLVLGFTATKGYNSEANRIDAFKLARVSYYLPDVIPDWVPPIPNNVEEIKARKVDYRP